MYGGLYPSYFWIESELNPSDDPSRDRPLRTPGKPLPSWWTPAVAGDFTKLDTDYPLHYSQGAPPFDELYGEESVIPASIARADRRDEASAKRARRDPALPEADPVSLPLGVETELVSDSAPPDARLDLVHEPASSLMPLATELELAAEPTPTASTPTAKPLDPHLREPAPSTTLARLTPTAKPQHPLREQATASSPAEVETELDIIAISGLSPSRFLRPALHRRDPSWVPKGQGVLDLLGLEAMGSPDARAGSALGVVLRAA